MGISQSLDILDNGVHCPIDNMKPAVFVVLAVVGLSAAAPQPDHGRSHGSGYQTQQKCHTTYKTIYETVYEEKCNTVYETDYTTEYKKECSTYYDTTYETACETSYKKECYGYGYDKKCKSVPVEKCHQVPKQIPRESCQDIPIQVPVQVPRQVCESIPKQVAKQIPEKKCDSYGHGHSSSSGYPHH